MARRAWSAMEVQAIISSNCAATPPCAPFGALDFLREVDSLGVGGARRAFALSRQVDRPRPPPRHCLAGTLCKSLEEELHRSAKNPMTSRSLTGLDMELSAIRSLFGLFRQGPSHIPKLLLDNQCRFVGGYLLIEPVSGRQDIVKELMQR